ncbi:MAG: hypothetical protein KF753_06670 [Caldilineaceae bacterium]|nr:hypothetical protein [Caldilineaceae bacterium]
MSYFPEFAALLNQYLASQDRSASWLAQRVGVHPGTVGRWLNQGARPGSPELLVQIADLLGVHNNTDRQALLAAAGYGYQEAASAARQKVELFQSGPPTSPGLPSSEHPRHNLPLISSSFVGREVELARITIQLTDPAVRLVTIVGPGGMGKSRLALQAGRSLGEHFADGVWFVALAAVDSPQQMATAILEAIPGGGGGGGNPETRVLDLLRERTALLILDNLEHLPQAPLLVAQILEHAPGVTVLATSREPLALASEWVIQLSGLAIPAPGPQLDAATLEEYSAVRLFLERARRFRPQMALDAETARNLLALCRLVGGHPLALEMAASWLRTLSLPIILQEVQNNLDMLEANLRDAPERHRSIRSLFDASWQRLTEQEQAVLCQLSVFEGGFDKHAAQTVAGASLRTLAGLVDASWVQAARGERFDLHPLILAYAREKVAQSAEFADSDVEALHHRHSDYFSIVAAQYNTAWGLVLADTANIRTGWNYALQRLYTSLIDRYLHTVFLVAVYEGITREVDAAITDKLREVDRAIEQGDNDPEQMLRSALLADGHAKLANRTGTPQVAEEYMRQALARLDAMSDHLSPLRGEMLQTLGWILLTQSRAIEADEQWRRALQIQLSNEIPSSVAFILKQLAYSANEQGRYDDALKYLLQVQEFAKEDEIAPELYRGELWQMFIYQGRLDEAKKYQSAAGDTHSNMSSPTLDQLFWGRDRLARGDLAAARQHTQLALESGQKLDISNQELWALNDLGTIELRAGNTELAGEYFRRGLAAAQKMGRGKEIGRARNGLGFVALVQGKVKEADEGFMSSLALAWPLGILPEALAAVIGLAAIEAQHGQPDRAIAWLEIALAHPGLSYTQRLHTEPLWSQLTGNAPIPTPLPWDQAQAALEPVIAQLLG